MSLSIADTVFLCGSLIGFGGAFIYLGIALYIAYTKMDMMLAYFKNMPIYHDSSTDSKWWALGAIIRPA